MDSSKGTVENLNDLPNFKESFSVPLAEFGVNTIEDILNVFNDEEKTASMISAVKGLGPRTVLTWKNALKDMETPIQECVVEPQAQPSAEEVPEETEANPEMPKAEEAEEAVAAKEEEPSPTTDEPEIRSTKAERSTYCTMVELKEIERSAKELLRMNGSKKKGIAASLEYVSKRLGDVGMDITVNGESGFPTMVASKGEGGVVLWGHLDTDRMKGMKKKEQGVVASDMIRGRGAADMRGAIAVMLCAANRLTSWNVPFSIILTTDGLGEQKGAEMLARNPIVQNSKGILMVRPTGMKPLSGQVGYAALKVRTHGKTAVMDMASFLKALAGLEEEGSGKLSIKTGLIKGGKKKRPFEAPDTCEVVLELETIEPTGSTISAIKGPLEGIEYEVEVLCQNEMIEFDGSSELANVMKDLTNEELAFQLVQSEAVNLISTNNRIVVWGPGIGSNAAGEHEYVTLSDLERTYEIIMKMMDSMSPL